ncbi:MAG TPA: S53 family peptidase [Chloroflexia bacterium]|nr:S53 family peptidase [Chloroflexia bacterium]
MRLQPYFRVLSFVSALGLAFSIALSAGEMSQTLDFVPLAAVAPNNPNDASGANAAGTACNTTGLPGPVYKSDFYHCYTPAVIQQAYGVDKLHQAGITGQGQVIILVDSYGSPTALSDLQTFSTAFNLPAPNLEIIYPDGAPTYNNAVNGSPSGWAFETNLDLQWAHAIAPNAKLVLVAGNPAETQGVQGFPSLFKGLEMAINKYPGAVVSQSFGVTEQSFQGAASTQVARFDQVYQEAIANRVTLLASAGDNGTANTDKQGRLYPYKTAGWPASDPLVTAAGGTWLQSGWTWNPTVSADTFYNCLNTSSFGTCATSYLNATSGGSSEAVWKEDWLPAATGGTLSSLYSTPDYQKGLNPSLLQGRRGVPDVSWNAAVDGGALVYTSFGGARVGWHPVGGTSAASPQLAGLVALANQLADNSGKQHIGFLNPYLYQLPGTAFRDIVPQTYGTGSGVTTLDSNQEYGSGVPGEATTTGYDLTTGLGVPVADVFVQKLVNMLPAK